MLERFSPKMTDILISFAGGLFAAYIGVISGSGGLISLGALLFMGYPLPVAIATNRLASITATGSGLWQYNKSKKVNWRLGWQLAIPGAIGALIGSSLLLNINERMLEIILATVLSCMIPFIFFNKKLGLKTFEPSIYQKIAGYLIYFSFGILAGLFGVGIGTLSIIVIAGIFGQTMTRAVATNLVAWIFLSATALVVFITNDLVAYRIAIPMMLGMLIGGGLGAKLAIKKGDTFVKTVLLLVQTIVVIKLIFF